MLTGEIIDKDLLILSDKLRKLTPSQVRTVEAIIDECNNLFNQKEITLLSKKEWKLLKQLMTLRIYKVFCRAEIKNLEVQADFCSYLKV